MLHAFVLNTDKRKKHKQVRQFSLKYPHFIHYANKQFVKE